jgi:hypothetical protein
VLAQIPEADAAVGTERTEDFSVDVVHCSVFLGNWVFSIHRTAQITELAGLSR